MGDVFADYDEQYPGVFYRFCFRVINAHRFTGSDIIDGHIQDVYKRQRLGFPNARPVVSDELARSSAGQ